MAKQILVNIGSGNDGTKPLPEPMLAYYQSWSVQITWELMNFIHNINEITLLKLSVTMSPWDWLVNL